MYSEIDYVSLYSYSKEYTLEEFIKLGNCFKICNNLKNVFKTLENLIKGISFKVNNTSYDSKMELKVSSDQFLSLHFKIPMMYLSYENIEIKFDRKEKNFDEQYKILRQKYLKLRKLINEQSYNYDCYYCSKIKEKFKDFEKDEWIKIYFNQIKILKFYIN